MNDTKKLAAFLRTAIRDGVTVGIDHPFAESAKRFYADVDVLSVSTADKWFADNQEQAELVNQVYEAYNAYNAEEPAEEAEKPVQEAADTTVSEIEKLQARIQALEDAQSPAPETTPAPAGEETPAAEA